MPKDGVIPSGSKPVNATPDDDKVGQGNVGEPGNAEATGKEGGEESPYLGDWKTKEEAEKGHKELLKKLGSQGEEIGTIKAQNQKLYDALSQIQANNTADQNAEGRQATGPEAELDKALAEYEGLNWYEDENAPKKGSEILRKVVASTAQMVKEQTLEEAGTTVESLFEQRDVEAQRDRFIEANPDFLELQNSGALDEIIKSDPMHDDFSAFIASKLNAAEAKIAEQNAELEELRRTAQLAEGEQVTQKVFTKPGANLRDKQSAKGPMTVSEIKASAIQAVRSLNQT